MCLCYFSVSYTASAQGRQDEHHVAPATTASPPRLDTSTELSDDEQNIEHTDSNDEEIVEHTYLDDEQNVAYSDNSAGQASSDSDVQTDVENRENEALPESDGSASSEEADIAVSDLAREWYLLQLGRVCSNEVSSDHWDFAWKYCDLISELKRNGKGKKFPELRKKVLKECSPEMKMDYIFKDRSLPDDSEDYTFVFNRETYPKKEYPFDRYELMAQITHCQVKKHFRLYKITFV